MRYTVYLESYSDGRSMAHILDLPGCSAIGHTREEAQANLRAAAQGYHLWLNSHGDFTAHPDEPVELEMVEVVEGVAPLTPGDAAAVFRPEREPLDDATLARGLRLMAYSRSDLTTAVNALSEADLDRPADAEWSSLRRLLEHVANSEEWYISRLGAEDHPYHLAMNARFETAEVRVRLVAVREMAVRRLAVLTPAERSAVFTRAVYTDHPDEEWTARKVLRRFVEHEREHLAQITALLDGGRE